jgi:RsiW-degrading membrane proteinase PrsW (M82 family)
MKLRFLALLAFLVLLPACLAERVAGTADVELSYEADAEQGPAPFGEDLRAHVLRRLGALQIGADVTEDGRHLRVIVDDAVAGTADELVTWSGSLLVLAPDPTYFPNPRDTNGLTAMEEPLPNGGVDRFWQGKREDVTRAATQWVLDGDHRLVAEARWEIEGDDPPWRTRIVRTTPIAELASGVMVGRGEGGSLRLRAARGTPAESALADARASLVAPVLVRGRTSLGIPTFTDDAAVLRFGSGVRAYARAQRERLLLTTPQLPALRRVGSLGLPRNTTLATACFVVPILLSLAWLAFVRRFDRAHPEPMWLVLVTFLLGGLATVPAGLAELVLARASPWLDPRIVTFGGQVYALPLSFAVFTVVVGFVEEGAKLLGATFALRRREFDEPVDGIVYGIVSSLGFAAAENFHYFAVARLAAPTVIARCFMSVPAHMFFGAIWGYALGARLVDKNKRVFGSLALAAAAHGLFDAFLSTDGAGLLAVLLEVALASVFVVLVRRALRHGVVDEEVRAVPAAERRMFRVGREAAFFASSFALHALAFGIFLFGAWYQLARHRPSALFVVASSVMLALLAIAAFGVSATLPLDVVIDDYGVTFAGAGRPWRRIRGFSRERDHVLLDCEAGPLHLGPAPPATTAAIASALEEHVGGAGRLRTLESG